MRHRFFCTALLFIGVVSARSFGSNILFDPKEAFTLAKKSNKPVLLVFSGSDWCVPCIQFEKNILSDSTFSTFANEQLIVLEADFPQKKELPETLKKQYEQLADKYNPNGIFPYIVVINAAGKPLGNFVYLSQTAGDFLADVKKVLK